MGKYKLLIYPAAKRDLQDVVDYVNESSSESAIRLYDAIVKKIGSLSQMPQRCPLLKSPVLRAKGYHMLKVDNYLVFYVIRGKTVEIRRILQDRRQYESIL
jgi:toxin ParE1/3/4